MNFVCLKWYWSIVSFVCVYVESIKGKAKFLSVQNQKFLIIASQILSFQADIVYNIVNALMVVNSWSNKIIVPIDLKNCLKILLYRNICKLK